MIQDEFLRKSNERVLLLVKQAGGIRWRNEEHWRHVKMLRDKYETNTPNKTTNKLNIGSMKLSTAGVH